MPENKVEVEITVEERQALQALTKLTKQTDKFTTTQKQAGKQADSTFKSVAAGVVVANAVSRAFQAVANRVGQSVDEFRQYSKAVAEVNTLLPENAKLTKEITDELINLSSQFGTKPQAQAKALYQIISSGAATGSKAVQLLADANTLALGGLAELTDVVNVLTDATNIYGSETLSSTSAADSLFTAVKLGKTNIQALSSSLGQVLPLSQRLGISFDDVNAALATLTTQGLSTNQRVTQLNSLFTALLKKGGDAERLFGKKVADAFNVTALKTKGLNLFLQDLVEATGNSDEVLQKLIGRTEGVQAVFGLTGNAAETFTNNIDEFTRKSGAASAAAKELQNDLDFQLVKADQAITNIITKIIDRLSPALINTLKFFNGITDAASAASNPIEAIAIFGKQAAEEARKIRFEKASAEDLRKEIEQTAQLLEEARTREGFSFKVNVSDVEQLQAKIKELQGELGKKSPQVLFEPKDVSGVNDIFNAITKGQEKIAEGVPSLLARPEGQADDAEVKKTDAIVAELERRQELIDAIQAQALLDQEQLALEQKLQSDTANEEDLEGLQNILQAKKDLNESFSKEDQALIQKNAKARSATEKKTADDRAKIEKDTFFKIQQFDKLSGRQRVANLRSTLGSISTLQSSSNKTLFAVGKAAAIGTATIDGISAVQKALASAPPPFNFALAALVGVATAANIAKIVAQKPPSFQNGGFVPGNSFSGDNVAIQANSGEFVANQAQQRNIISNLANNPVSGSSDELVREIRGLSDQIGGQEIVLVVDNKQIARATRTARQEGFAI